MESHLDIEHIKKALTSDISRNASKWLEALDELISSEGGHNKNHQHAMPVGHDEHGGHVMKMWFHGGCEEVILFDFWRIDSCLGLLLSCIIIFVMGALYEGVKWFRVYLRLTKERKPTGKEGRLKQKVLVMEKINQGTAKENEQRLLENGGQPSGESVNPVVGLADFAPTSTPPSTLRRTRSDPRSPLEVFRLAEALLYAFQLVLAYWLMLIVMTYNSWLS